MRSTEQETELMHHKIIDYAVQFPDKSGNAVFYVVHFRKYINTIVWFESGINFSSKRKWYSLASLLRLNVNMMRI